MKIKIIFANIALLFFLSPITSWAKDYNASLFGIKSDGITLNTQSIQKAIDFIHEKGGGKLDFYVGRYLTGTIQLKSNVQIELKEGAVLVGTTSIHDYLAVDGKRGLIVAEGQEHIGVFGKGVIEGQGAGVYQALSLQIKKGYLTENPADASPAIVTMSHCKDIRIEGLHVQNACGDALYFSQSQGIQLKDVAIKNTVLPALRGIGLVACEEVTCQKLFIESSGAEFSANAACKTVTLENCKSAAGKLLGVAKK